MIKKIVACNIGQPQETFLLILNKRSDLLLSRESYSGVNETRMFEGWVPNFRSGVIILGRKIWDVFLGCLDVSRDSFWVFKTV